MKTYPYKGYFTLENNKIHCRCFSTSPKGIVCRGFGEDCLGVGRGQNKSPSSEATKEIIKPNLKLLTKEALESFTALAHRLLGGG